ncbi:hypothetical protein M406DRAFT_267871 [Cryphonectria parasitica EP155]|uniref:Pleckstrin homology domain-containing protein n=1 Tax=Cryphonectria parasitica (strain ATCC 38755 / EP155) TaxID=660469 RepID=A0A9P4XTS6_CRYP1|nr:uncharacterized protein M406DRAFT_267871 [Cryphonectria parasitica EP155]KAF3761092.1 hypothetical protein M406DRAFT_267871 [Cryphonectria parasitica EP155]
MESTHATTAAWETEDEMSVPTSSATLTTPMEAKPPSRGSRPSSRSSRRSRRSVTPPGRITKSPPPMPGSDKTDKSDRVVRDLATDEKISILDPRRFTPTLHANLVAEILSLKRDQDEKLKVIEGLEATLQSARDEGDNLETSLLNTSKENRSLKRQLALLEGGTSSALGELARERDEAVDAAAETRRRLETAQKKLKAQEDDSERTNDLWAKDKDAWEEDRRKTDRKIHVLETRLKMVLEEMAEYQAAALNDQAVPEEDAEDRARDSDAGSIRSMNVRESLRFSLLQKANGHSLADELDFDDDSDYQTDANGRDSVMSNYRHARSGSRASVLSRSHHRHNSNDSLVRSGSVARVRFQPQSQLDDLTNDVIQEDDEVQRPVTPKVSYTDTGIQYSPSPSPKISPVKAPTPPAQEPMVQALAAKWEKHYEEGNNEANQRRKRTSIAKPLAIQPPAPQKLMVSAAAQTSDVPLTPPKTPKSPTQEQQPKLSSKEAAVMVSAGTQTDAPVPPRPATPPTPSLAIPSIAIHPPTSRPSSPKQSRLPQLSRDFACQVSLWDVPMTSIGIQTEEIRIDQRLDRLPPHLHPSAITSRPTSPAAESQASTVHAEAQFTPVPGNVPPRNPRRLTTQRSFGDSAPSPRDSLDQEAKSPTTSTLSHPHKSTSRKTHRISNMFADHIDASSADEMDDFGLSDSEFRTALSAPRAVKSPEPGRATPVSAPTSPEESVARPVSGSRSPVEPLEPTSAFTRYKLSGNQGVAMPQRESSTKVSLRASSMASSMKSGGMRKAAMIQNGINTHQEDAADPPFPIPTRASSRQPVFSAGGRSADDRSPTRRDPWHRKGTRTTHYRTNSVRKSRSAVAGQGRSRRKNSRSPSFSPTVPQTPTVPSVTQNTHELVTPRNERPQGRGHRHQNSGTTATTEATGFRSNEGSQAANGVVDAIAQTMVGEWMFKYVRRRKSFGMSADTSSKDDSSNDRHRRWVWLAPYERAILWSSKQPSSGSALLGKSGRKLTIQSVLDVKDDNPAPKGQLAVFNRSILILTPQRALKFTAVNAERHYLWLTALSFLAHSQQDVPEIPTTVPKHAPEYELPPEQNKVRRPRIRDSIRLAKSQNPILGHKNAPSRSSGGVSSTIESRSSYSHPSIPETSSYSNNNNNNVALQHERDCSGDAAIPPAIPRFGRDQVPPLQTGFHGRKRSNTGGRVPPPLSFRGFGGSPTYAHNPNNNSQSTNTGSSDVYYGGNGPRSAEMAGEWSGRNSEASSWRDSVAGGGGGGNLFEAIGTVRMEAFISPLAYSRYESDGQLDYPDPLEDSRMRARKRTKEIRRQKSRSRSRSRNRETFARGGVGGWKDEYWGYSRHRTVGEESSVSGSGRGNPFEGF